MGVPGMEMDPSVLAAQGMVQPGMPGTLGDGA